jgi:GNAT superfamily N-acetyltransferase
MESRMSRPGRSSTGEGMKSRSERRRWRGSGILAAMVTRVIVTGVRELTIRPLVEANRAAWEPLWAGYAAFYKAAISPEITELTWRRFQDPAEPMHALGGFVEGELRGIVHYIFHRSCWTEGPYCYLQDLFTHPEFRRGGIGRSLIEAVYTRAAETGASRVYWLTHETNTTAMALYDSVADRTGFLQYRKLLK